MITVDDAEMLHNMNSRLAGAFDFRGMQEAIMQEYLARGAPPVGFKRILKADATGAIDVEHKVISHKEFYRDESPDE